MTIMTLMSFAVLFYASCGGVEPVIITDGVDILGFVESDVIIADKPIEKGVIVTPEFMIRVMQMADELADCRKKLNK